MALIGFVFSPAKPGCIHVILSNKSIYAKSAISKLALFFHIRFGFRVSCFTFPANGRPIGFQSRHTKYKRRDTNTALFFQIWVHRRKGTEAQRHKERGQRPVSSTLCLCASATLALRKCLFLSALRSTLYAIFFRAQKIRLCN